MFNTKIYSNATTHEHRAPTDESIRLLREMESKAKAEVLKAITLPSNELKGVAHIMREPSTCDTHVAVLFKLNNKDVRVDIRLNEFADSDLDKRMEKIVKSVSNRLAAEVCEGIFTRQLIKQLEI